jgi:PTS system nitrogen regulatory IIA component
MELADILNEESVLFCSDVTTKREVLEKLSQHAATAAGAPASAVFEAINGREALGSTGLGNGIAIPHGKLPGLHGVTAVFARLDTPIDFDAVDDQPVDLIMLLLAPLGAGADHLKALALVARMLRTESVVEQLRTLKDPARIYALLTQQQQTHKAA